MYNTYVRFYGRLVLAGRLDIKDVPEMYREDVESWVAGH